MLDLTVVIPVGPSIANRRWLDEALDSVLRQDPQPREILLIDDGANLEAYQHPTVGIGIYTPPWRLGVAHAFNFGVALAYYPLVFFLGSDDRLLPSCLQACIDQYEANDREDAYYAVGVQYSDGRPDQAVPCNAAMVTKSLWNKTGGFAPESASGAPDAAFLSMLTVHKHAAPIYPVAKWRPLYWYRVHPDTDTAQRGPWQGVILETRNLLTIRGPQPITTPLTMTQTDTSKPEEVTTT